MSIRSQTPSQLETFLETQTINDVIRAASILHFVNTKSLLAEALDLMAEHHILSVPVFDDGKQRFVGLLDVHDVTSVNPSVDFSKEIVANVYNRSGVDVFIPTPRTRSLFNLIEIFTRGVYRIPVSEEEEKVENDCIFEGIGGGSAKKLITLISQSSVIRHLANNIDILTPGQASISLDELRIGHKKVFSVNGNQPALEALAILEKNKVGAVAVVNDQGAMIETFSASNLRGLTGDKMYLLNHSVLSFLAERKDAAKRNQLYTCQHTSTLKEVIVLMAVTGAHRLWILDEHRKAEGVVSTADVMKAVLISLRKEHQCPKE